MTNTHAHLDTIASRLTAFDTFASLLDAEGYRPTIRIDDEATGDDALTLADAYDGAQSMRGDTRRTFRSGVSVVDTRRAAALAAALERQAAADLSCPTLADRPYARI